MERLESSIHRCGKAGEIGNVAQRCASACDQFGRAAGRDQIDAQPGRTVLDSHEGPVQVEAWSVMHSRDNSPERFHAACLTPGGERVWAITHDADVNRLKETAADFDLLEDIFHGIAPRNRLLLMDTCESGEGGEESALFAGDLFRLYAKFAEHRGWKIEVLDSTETDLGGLKSLTMAVKAPGTLGPEAAPYGVLKFEGGVHRVQRVPETEAQGRVHTSAVTVAVLPEAQAVDIAIDENDLQIDVYRSSGPGGQSVNTTDSAVRVTYKPTGLVVTCQDEKSQHKNKAKALMVLRSRLLAQKEEEEAAERSANRKSQVGSGDRSERIRTYNFPPNRATEHPLKLTLTHLETITAGDHQGINEE